MDKQPIDILWVAICAVLVFLMQGGFLCLEAGLVRSKNYINVAIKNIMDMGITVLIFWALGFGLMFGVSETGWFGTSQFFRSSNGHDLWGAVFWVFQAMFCGTCVTILSGAVAERMRITGYFVAVMFVAGLIYPVAGHWMWGGLYEGEPSGWLAKMGFVDFAGSTVVHSVGGWVALAGVLVVGSRLGRFPKDGPAQEIPGANIPLAALGVLILWFGWFGFNGGSTLSFNNTVPRVISNTLLGGSAGLVAAVLYGVFFQGRVAANWAMNGVLAGAVAVTANCHAINAPLAVIIGMIGGIIAVLGDLTLEKLRIDDAVGAIPVHLFAGIWGTLAVGLFGDLEILGTGLTRPEQIGVQLLGIGVTFAWAFSLGLAVFYGISRVIALRVSPEDELLGLNISEHGARTEILDFYMVLDRQQKTGDLTLRVPEEPFTEVGQIASRYNAVMEKLEESVAMNDAIIRTSADAIITVDRDNYRVMTINPAAARLLGISSEKAIGQSIASLVSLFPETEPDNILSVSGLLEELAGTSARAEYMVQIPNGIVRPVQLVVAESEVRETAFYTITLSDLQNRREADAQLRLTRDQYEALVDEISDIVIGVGSDGRITSLNAAGEKLLRVSIRDLIGRPVHEAIFPPDLRERVQFGLKRIIAAEDPSLNDQTMPTRIVDFDRNTIPVELTIERFQSEQDVSLLLIFRVKDKEPLST